jgi:hypothetical protein
MELSAGRAGHDFVRPRLVRRLLGKQSLHPHARPGASKHDHTAHGANIGVPRFGHFDPDQNSRLVVNGFYLILGTQHAFDKKGSPNVLWLDPRQIWPIDLNRPAMELLRSVQVSVEGSSQTANQKPRILCQIERRAVDLDHAVGNQLLQARR